MKVTAREHEIANNILKHLVENSLIINPYFSLYDWAKKIVRSGGCPCVPNRKTCPCAESLNDIKEEGICKCKFIMNSEYYFNYVRLISN